MIKDKVITWKKEYCINDERSLIMCDFRLERDNTANITKSSVAEIELYISKGDAFKKSGHINVSV